MAQAQMLQVKLSRFDAQPWGFRLQGGTDFAAPLLVQKVNAGSLAEKAGLIPGDAVIKINDVDVFNLRHKDAQDIVVRSGNNFVMTIQRGGSTWRPHVTPTGQIPQHNQSPYLQTVTKTSLAHKQQDSQHIGCGYNNSARPFANGGGDGSLKSIVNKQYNTPVGIYSDESIAETLSAQAEVLAGGVLGVNFKKNEKEYQAEKSEVLKFLREEESGHSTPAFNSHAHQHHEQHQHQHQHQHQAQPQQHQLQPQQQHQQQHQHHQQQHHYQQQQSTTRHVSAPVNTPKPPSTGGLPTGQNICSECERLISGVFVRIKDKNLHVECFKCATCGTSLKNQGYYNFSNKLYCEIHAKLAAQQNPPPGTEGYVPVPIKPNTKLSATTVSSALSAHGYGNGVANGGSTTPTPSSHEDSTDLPLPPPPSPTQLKQYENEILDKQQQLLQEIQKQQQQKQHTRTNSNLSTQSSNSNTSTTSASTASTIPTTVTTTQLGQQQTNSNALSLERFNTPLHSHQSSSSSSSVSVSSPTTATTYTAGDMLSGSYNYVATDAVIQATPLPPPPPPMPVAALYNQNVTLKSINGGDGGKTNAVAVTRNNNKRYNNGVNNSSSNNMLQQHSPTAAATTNENDMNTQNNNNNKNQGPNTQTHNAYNKLLKEYSNKLTQSSNNNNNNIQNNHNNNNKLLETQQNLINNENEPNNKNETLNKSLKTNTFKSNHNNNQNNNNTPKPLNNINNSNSNNNNKSPNIRLPGQQSHVAATAATLANQLKFNPPPTSTQVPKSSSIIVAPTSLPPPPSIPIPPSLFESSGNNLFKEECQMSLMSASSNAMPTESIYGQINQSNGGNGQSAASSGDQSDKPFEYVTLTGNVIRSVVPPGKGANINYRVNQGYARPFGASPAAAAPPAAAPKSPISYPPSSNPYATLPRANVGQQGRHVHYANNYSSNYSTQYRKPQQQQKHIVAPNKYTTMPRYRSMTPSYSTYNASQSYDNAINTSCNYNYNRENDNFPEPEYAEEFDTTKPLPPGAEYFEDEPQRPSRQKVCNFIWPPPKENDDDEMPTAAPLYIAPPETQHVTVKPLQHPPPPPPGSSRPPQKPTQETVSQNQAQENLEEASNENESQEQCESKKYWQSRSAPQLTTGSMQQQAPEFESSSDSYTSTCTTTTTSSEEYKRMYAAQLQQYQMQQAYEQSGSEMDYHMDMEMAQMQQQQQLQQQMDDTAYVMNSTEYMSGRRSAQECADMLYAPLNTYKLVDMVREVTPSPVPQQPASTRRVFFSDETEVKVVPNIQNELESNYADYQNEANYSSSNQNEFNNEQERQQNEEIENYQAGENYDEQEAQAQQMYYDEPQQVDELVLEDRSHILESQRIFQPTPEIKIEIPPVRHIPPTKIPNPMPKEWINPMVRALTTAPEVPFHMVDCLCPKPCDCQCQVDPATRRESTIELQTLMKNKAPIEEPYVRPASPEPYVEPVMLQEIPPTGSKLTKAMATAPEFTVRFAPPPAQPVPLPEETEPYMPPPMDMKPYLREDYRPKSPFLSALTTAPDTPFEGHFDKDVPIHGIDLPTPTAHLTMSDALCTASTRPYTPLDPENAWHRAEAEEQEKERKKYEFQVLEHEEELGIRPEPIESVKYYTTEQPKTFNKPSAFAATQAFQPNCQPLQQQNQPQQTQTPPTPRNSVISLTKDLNDLEFERYCKAKERNQKRLDYYHKRENELMQQQQQQQLTQQLQKQQQIQQQMQQQQNNTQKALSSSFSANQATSTSTTTSTNFSSNSSSTVQDMPSATATAPASASTTATACSNSYANSKNQSARSSFSAASASSSQAQQQRTAATTLTTSKKLDSHELIEETVEELEHSEVLFPPPSPLSHLKAKTASSGLHRPDSIPKYQRNWTVLPTQSPIRTPEPPELRENIPLAFVDAPKTPSAVVSSASNPVYRPVAQMSTTTTTAAASNNARSSITSSILSADFKQAPPTPPPQPPQTQSQPFKLIQPKPQQQQQQQKPVTIPIIVEDRSVPPVTMAFQSIDEQHLSEEGGMQIPSRPSSVINKPAPIIPFYQTPEKLCFDECPATHAREYDRCSASPFPDRARSPAPGPPPNPLSAIRAPRMKDSEPTPVSPRILAAGSITTGQSYLGAQQQQQAQQQVQQQQQQQQGRILSHQESSMQSGSQSFVQKPETFEQQTIGNTTIQKREQESRLDEQKKSQMESQTTSQVGNMQIERRRKVTEEYEHTQKAKTIEIRTGSTQQTIRGSTQQSVMGASQSQNQKSSIAATQQSIAASSTNQQSSSSSMITDRRQSYGKTGFVANQARRLSGMDQEINSQSQAINALAATLAESTSFPQIHSPETTSKFPIRPAMPVYNQPRRPSYIQLREGQSSGFSYGGAITQLQQQAQQQQLQQQAQQQQLQQQQLQQQQQSLSSTMATKSTAATTQQTSSLLSSSASSTMSSSLQQQTKTLSNVMRQQQHQQVNSSVNAAAAACLTQASSTNNNKINNINQNINKKQQQVCSYPCGGGVLTATGVCPVTGTFCRPGHTCCRQQQLQTMQPAIPQSNNSNNNNNGNRPYASSGASAATAATAALDTAPNSNASMQPPSQPPTNLCLSDNFNQGNGSGSSGAGGKGGAFGATSAPKRGRGIYNKAVAPGVRVPMCNSCNMHISENMTVQTVQSSAQIPTTTTTRIDSKTADLQNDEATQMLAESIGKINMGNKMNNFMTEAGKIISNMLEARLANGSGGGSNCGSNSMSNGSSTLSLRSNSSSNLSKSPMVMRKRFELDDFKDLDPTEPSSLKPVVAVQQQITLQNPNQMATTALGSQKAQPQVPKANGTLMRDMHMNHAMGKVLDLCDNKEVGVVKNNGNSSPPLPVSETVVYRNDNHVQRRLQRDGERSTHAFDRRSYIELPPPPPPPTQTQQEFEDKKENLRDGPVFSINVKPLGPNNGNGPMSPENEEVVSQLLKDGKRPICCQCDKEITTGPFITALGRIWCPDHFICVNANCRRPLQDIGFVEEKGDLYCEYCFEKYLAPTCSKCGSKIKGDCLNAIGKHFHPECFTCGHCGKMFGNTPFFLEDGLAYCEADWNELFTTKCFACGFPVEAGDRWVEALNHNYHSQCFNCTYCKQNLEGQSFYNKGGRPFCKNHAR